MNHSQEIKTKGSCQSAEKHCTEQKRAFICMMMWSKIIVAEETELEYGVVGTESQVANAQNTQQLQTESQPNKTNI